MASRSNPAFMNGIPELLALRLLGEREMYGYELVEAATEATEGEIELAEGVVYPLLQALAARGHLRRRERTVAGRRRIYYRITPKGRRRLAGQTTEWRRIAQAVHDLLREEGHDRQQAH